MPHRAVAACSAAVLAALAAAITIDAQSNAQPPSGTPQFRTGVALLRIDASVVDSSGRAVADMSPGDFEVHIDGRPRKVVFAQFTGVPAAPAAAGPVVPAYAVNTSQRGRAIAVVVDLASIRAGSERPLLDTAAQLVERLGPSDAVGLVPLPGQSVDVTRDHARIAGELRGLRGTSDAPLFRHYFTLEEANAFERRDKRVIDEVIERECARDVEAVRAERAAAGGGTATPLCPTDLERETRERLWYERRHIEMVLTSLVNLAQQLRRVPAPTTILLISGGVGFDQESLARFQQVEATLKQAGLAIYAVQVDQREVEATDSRPAKATLYSSRDRESGLANVATMSGGAFFAGVGRAQGVFERLRTEITEAYELGVEAVPGDLDGKPHQVKVATSRKATIRARPYYVSAAAAPADWAARLANLLTQPIDMGGLPIAAAAYSVRGDEAATLKVLIRAEVGRGVPPAAPVRYAVAIIGPRDTGVLNVTGTAAADGGILLSTQLAPGRYRARIAAIDASGRTGSLDVQVVAGMRMGGGLQLSDVIPGVSPDAPLKPAIYLAAGAPFAPSLELSSDDSARFARTNVGFEVRRPGGAEVIATGEGRLLETAYERQRIASASLATDALEPGEYTVSAVVKVEGQPAARVSRTFILEASAPAAAATAPAPAPPAPEMAANVADRPVPRRPADPELDALLDKAAAYVTAYGEQMSAVVAVEKYTQYVNSVGGSSTRPRRLLAEFALVKSGGLVPWTGYRDVIEVDGEPIHDRRDRLLKILTESGNPLEEAARLTAESARFNVGPVSRNFNVPTAALFFFHEGNLSRFTFTRRGARKIDGVDTSELAFRETARPTIVTTRAGRNVPCNGTLWIASDGTIVRTRLQLSGFADAIAMSGPMIRTAPAPTAPGTGTVSSPAPVQPAPPAGAPAGTGGASGGAQGSTSSPGPAPGRGSTAGDQNSNVSYGRAAGFPDMTMTTLDSTADIEVTYRRDERLGMWLPVRMTEEYQGAIPRLNNPPILGTARSTAEYSDYRRFETGAKVVGPKK
jgi:VWFA-related protein